MQAEITYTRDSGEKLVNETFGPNNIRRRTSGSERKASRRDRKWPRVARARSRREWLRAGRAPHRREEFLRSRRAEARLLPRSRGAYPARFGRPARRGVRPYAALGRRGR